MAQPIQDLAALMASGGMPAGEEMMPGGEMEGGEEMVPCPTCMGTGMVTEDVAEAMGGGMPQSLAMRMPPQLSQYPQPSMSGGMPLPNMGA